MDEFQTSNGQGHDYDQNHSYGQNSGNQHGFGNELKREKWGGGRTFAKRIKYFIPALLALGFAIFMWTDPYFMSPGYEEIDLIIVFASVLALLFFILLAFTLVKRSEIVIYEEGFTYKRGRRLRSFSYGMMSATYRESGVVGGGWIIGGLIGMLPIFQVHKFNILDHSTSRLIALRHRRTPGYKYMTRELEIAFARYLMRNITMENLHMTNISFGDQLALRQGHLIQIKRKWRKTEETGIPFEYITRITDTDPIILEGPLNAKGKPDTIVNLGDTGRNIEVLRMVVYMVQYHMAHQSMAQPHMQQPHMAQPHAPHPHLPAPHAPYAASYTAQETPSFPAQDMQQDGGALADVPMVDPVADSDISS